MRLLETPLKVVDHALSQPRVTHALLRVLAEIAALRLATKRLVNLSRENARLHLMPIALVTTAFVRAARCATRATPTCNRSPSSGARWPRPDLLHLRQMLDSLLDPFLHRCTFPTSFRLLVLSLTDSQTCAVARP